MKKLTIILLLAVFALTGKAQSPLFELGLKAGVNTSKISTNRSDYTNNLTPKALNHYLFGAFARVNFGPIYIQPEAYYNSKGGEYIDKVNANTINSFNLKTIDVPALVGFKIIDQKPFNLRVMAGPVFSFATSKSVDGTGVFTKANIENNFFGWQYGAGVDFLFLTLDVRGESHASNLYASPDFNTKNANFIVSLGVKF